MDQAIGGIEGVAAFEMLNQADRFRGDGTGHGTSKKGVNPRLGLTPEGLGVVSLSLEKGGDCRPHRKRAATAAPIRLRRRSLS